MNRQLFVFATIVVIVNARAGRQGWGSSTTTTTVPPPTTDWPAPPPSSPGWSAPSAISASVDASAELAVAGSGWAASTQDAELLASSNTPDSEDPSQVSQLGYIGQYTGNNPDIVLGVQVADVNQGFLKKYK